MTLEECDRDGIFSLNCSTSLFSSLNLEKTRGLGSLVSGIVELTEKKRLIDMHLNIATALVDRIKQRNLDTYLKTEESIITHSTPVHNLIIQ